MTTIRRVMAREVLDSRGNPTVEVEMFSKKNSARAIVPSGASTGAREAVELRDHDSRYMGKGVLNAVQHVRDAISPRIIGRDCTKQEEIDNIMKELDGTINKAKIGANAILAVSMAACRLAAKETGKPLYEHIAGLANQNEHILPVPFMNVINGGAHAQNSLEMQEFMIAPIGAKNLTEAVRMCSETYHTLKEILRNLYGKEATNVGDEGGFAPPIKRTEDCLKILSGAIRAAGYEKEIKIGIDAAATQFWRGGKYHIDGKELDDSELTEYYTQLCQEYPIVSIEDPFNEEAFESFAKLTRVVGKNVQIIGDDLLVTNTSRIQQSIEKEACNALLLKLNQIGTVSESIAAAKLAQNRDYGVMVSHRSGDSEDTFIADLAVGINSGQIKSGAPCRAERTAKYNQLMRIEEGLGKKAIYSGDYFRYPHLLKIRYPTSPSPAAQQP